MENPCACEYRDGKFIVLCGAHQAAISEAVDVANLHNDDLRAALRRVDEILVPLLHEQDKRDRHQFLAEFSEVHDPRGIIRKALTGIVEKPKSEFAGCCSACNWSHEPHDCKCHAEKRVRGCPNCGNGVTGVDPLCEKHYSEYLGQNRARGNNEND